MTVGAWAQVWLDTTLAASSRKATTKELYGYLVAQHIVPPPLGTRRLDRLRPTDVEAFILELRGRTKPGRNEKGEPIQVHALADSTAQRIFSVLRLVMDGAVRDGHVRRNPVAVIKAPSAPSREARFLSPDEVVRLLEAARGSRYLPVLTLIAATGVRKGEALALTWADVDLDRRLMRIRGTLSRVSGELVVTSPKTSHSRRVLPLTSGMIALLTAHRAAQDLERVNAHNLWRERGFVFATETGAPLDPRNVLRALTTAARKAGLADVTVHTLRHSAATAMLESGVHPKAVSELLGHSDIRITADVYGHVSTAIAEAAWSRCRGRSCTEHPAPSDAWLCIVLHRRSADAIRAHRGLKPHTAGRCYTGPLRRRRGRLGCLRNGLSPAVMLVGDTGIEPVTSSVSGKRATAAPIAQGCAARWRWDSNPRIRLCRPLPRLSATPP